MAFGGGGKGFNTNNVIDNCTLTNNNALQQISNMAFEVCANNSGSITNCQVHLQNDGQTYNDFTAMTFDNTNQVWNTGEHWFFLHHLLQHLHLETERQAKYR